MRVALCQINPTVGALASNADEILDYAKRSFEQGANLAVFPELALCGYPPRDLLDRPTFVDDIEKELVRLAKELPPELTTLVGFVDRPVEAGRRLRNAVAVIRNGTVEHIVYKRLLPTYDVFDEDRYFEPCDSNPIVEVSSVRLGITVCEDIWNDVSVMAGRKYKVNPIQDVVDKGAEVIVNLSASPFTITKRKGRVQMLSEVARKHNRPIIYVNQVGGNDELIFDGASTIIGADGSVLVQAIELDEDLIVAEIGSIKPAVERAAQTDEEILYRAMVLGVRDYARKCGFKKAVMGLSGGIDSALTACVAVEALGKENVLGVAMPTRYSSQGSITDAEELAKNLGIELLTIDIEPLFHAYLKELVPYLDMLQVAGTKDTTLENMQSRIRCATLMAISNRAGHLLLTTGNKSEIAVGYCTLYGDMGGGLAVISDLPKTLVYSVATVLNQRNGTPLIPVNTITKAPSAELSPNQTDQDLLPPYDILDAILELHIEDGFEQDSIVSKGFEESTVKQVINLVRGSEYKRRQSAPGLILTRKAFGSGRRYPIAQNYKH